MATQATVRVAQRQHRARCHPKVPAVRRDHHLGRTAETALAKPSFAKSQRTGHHLRGLGNLPLSSFEMNVLLSLSNIAQQPKI